MERVIKINGTVAITFLLLTLTFTHASAQSAVPATSAEQRDADIFVFSPYVKLGLNNLGSIGSRNLFFPADVPVQPPYAAWPSRLGLIADFQKTGWTNFSGDYVVPGTCEETWVVGYRPSSSPWPVSYVHSADLDSTSSSPILNRTVWTVQDGSKAVWEGRDSAGLRVRQVVEIPDPSAVFVKFTVTVLNEGPSTLPDVRYLRNIDPDQEMWWNGNFITQQRIEFQPSSASDFAQVSARGLYTDRYLAIVANNYSASAHFGGFANRDPYADFDDSPFRSNMSDSRQQDEAVSMLWKLGDLHPGTQAKFSFAYVMAEPDVYKAALALGGTGRAFPTRSAGNGTGSFQDLVCPTNSVVTNFWGSYEADLGCIGIRCSPVAGDSYFALLGGSCGSPIFSALVSNPTTATVYLAANVTSAGNWTGLGNVVGFMVQGIRWGSDTSQQMAVSCPDSLPFSGVYIVWDGERIGQLGFYCNISTGDPSPTRSPLPSPTRSPLSSPTPPTTTLPAITSIPTPTPTMSSITCAQHGNYSYGQRLSAPCGYFGYYLNEPMYDASVKVWEVAPPALSPLTMVYLTIDAFVSPFWCSPSLLISPTLPYPMHPSSFVWPRTFAIPASNVAIQFDPNTCWPSGFAAHYQIGLSSTHSQSDTPDALIPIVVGVGVGVLLVVVGAVLATVGVIRCLRRRDARRIALSSQASRVTNVTLHPDLPLAAPRPHDATPITTAPTPMPIASAPPILPPQSAQGPTTPLVPLTATTIPLPSGDQLLILPAMHNRPQSVLLISPTGAVTHLHTIPATSTTPTNLYPHHPHAQITYPPPHIRQTANESEPTAVPAQSDPASDTTAVGPPRLVSYPPPLPEGHVADHVTLNNPGVRVVPLSLVAGDVDGHAPHVYEPVVAAGVGLGVDLYPQLSEAQIVRTTSAASAGHVHGVENEAHVVTAAYEPQPYGPPPVGYDNCHVYDNVHVPEHGLLQSEACSESGDAAPTVTL